MGLHATVRAILNISLILFSGAYSQETIFRTAAWAYHFMFSFIKTVISSHVEKSEHSSWGHCSWEEETWLLDVNIGWSVSTETIPVIIRHLALWSFRTFSYLEAVPYLHLLPHNNGCVALKALSVMEAVMISEGKTSLQRVYCKIPGYELNKVTNTPNQITS